MSRLSDPQAPPRGVSLQTALARLYAYWLLSTVVLVLAFAALGLYVSGALDRHQRQIASLEARLADRTAPVPRGAERAPGLRPETPPPGSAPPPREDDRPAPIPPAEPRRTEQRPSLPETAPSVQPTDDDVRSDPARSEAPRPLDDAGLASELAALLVDGPGSPEVRDRAAAVALLDRVRDSGGRVPLRPATWADLALLARVLGRDGDADALAGQIGRDDAVRSAYAMQAARVMLVRGAPREALALLEQVRNESPADRVELLRAAAEYQLGHIAEADEAIRRIGSFERLGPVEQLLAARLLVLLEQWRTFDGLGTALTSLPIQEDPLKDYLSAVLLARSGRPVEALATLDFLLGTLNAGASSTARFPLARLRKYDLDVERGALLAAAGRYEEARRALHRAAELEPARPDAFLQLGRLEAQAGRVELARAQLENALAQAPDLPAAWEALAIIELNLGNAARAVENASRAIAVQPLRASARLLRALAHGRMGVKDAAAEDLRAALAVDPSLLEEAMQADAFLRLFTPEELQRLAEGQDAETQGGGPADAGDGSPRRS